MNADDSDDWTQHTFTGMIKTLHHTTEMKVHRAIDRWKDVLHPRCKQCAAASRDQWKQQAAESCGKEFAENNIIAQCPIDGVGDDYCAANSWLVSPAILPGLEQKLKDRWGEDMMSHHRDVQGRPHDCGSHAGLRLFDQHVSEADCEGTTSTFQRC